MIYLVGIAGLAFIALLGYAKVESARATAAVAKEQQAESANKSLAADCTAKISGLTAQITARAADDAKRTAASRALLDARRKAAAGSQPAIDANVRIAKDPTKLATDADNAACAEIVSDYAKRATGAK